MACMRMYVRKHQSGRKRRSASKEVHESEKKGRKEGRKGSKEGRKEGRKEGGKEESYRVGCINGHSKGSIGVNGIHHSIHISRHIHISYHYTMLSVKEEHRCKQTDIV